MPERLAENTFPLYTFGARPSRLSRVPVGCPARQDVEDHISEVNTIVRVEKTEKFLVGGLLRPSGTGYPVIGGAGIPGEGGTIGGDGNGTLVVGTEKLHTCRAKFVQSLCMGMSVGIAGFTADDGIGGLP